MDMTFQLVDMLLPVPSTVDMLIIAMGRLLPAMDMDMLFPELPMVDMLNMIFLSRMSIKRKNV